MRLPLLAVIDGDAPSPAQFSTPTPPDCANYTVATLPDGTFACERYAAFPWFAAGQGWSTQVSMFTAPESRANNEASSSRSAWAPEPRSKPSMAA